MSDHQIVKVSDLGHGDRIRLFEDTEYGDATVYQVLPDGDVKVWRPYVHTGDVVYAGSRVIPYVGIEDFTLYHNTTVRLMRRGDKPR